MNYAPKVMNGTHGKLWLDGYQVAEVAGFSTKATFSKSEVSICGDIVVDSKVTSVKLTGELKIIKVFSRMQELLKDAVKGIDTRFTFVGELNDPDSFGAERVSILNVSFDEFTIFSFAHNSIVEETLPFTFTDYKFHDTVEVR